MTGGVAGRTLTVRAVRPNLVLRNESLASVGYVIVDSDAMMIMQYPPTSGSDAVLAPGEEISVPYSAIRQYSSESVAARVHWWRYARSTNDTLEPDGPLNTVDVALD